MTTGSSLPSRPTPRCRVGLESRVAHWLLVTSPIQTATATLHTNRGDIKIALFGNHAPKTVANFVGLAQGTKDYSTENASRRSPMARGTIIAAKKIGITMSMPKRFGSLTIAPSR